LGKAGHGRARFGKENIMKTLKCRLASVSPILMHNGARLPNPLDPICREMKKVSAKRSKTDSDFEMMSDLEFIGGLYTTEDPEITINGQGVKCAGGGKVCIPSEVIEATLIKAGKKSRKGDAFKSGVIVDQSPLMECTGMPSSVAALFLKRAAWRYIRPVKVQRATIMRTRPIFRDWSLTFEIQYLEDILDEASISEALVTAGQIVGLCDWRPKFGRFNVEIL
jgi:hypothetical protein